MVKINLKRTFRHFLAGICKFHRMFSAQDLREIEAHIQKSEKIHSAEIMFSIESHLSLRRLFNNQSSRERALEIFSLFRVWDTESNNGVLIYLLLADQQIEIIVDRGVSRLIESKVWEDICHEAEQLFKKKQYKTGVVKSVDLISSELKKHFPLKEGDINELKNVTIL